MYCAVNWSISSVACCLYQIVDKNSGYRSRCDKAQYKHKDLEAEAIAYILLVFVAKDSEAEYAWFC
jgi:hypothetical protein